MKTTAEEIIEMLKYEIETQKGNREVMKSFLSKMDISAILDGTVCDAALHKIKIIQDDNKAIALLERMLRNIEATEHSHEYEEKNHETDC